MSAREPHPRKQFVETAYKFDLELRKVIKSVRKDVWGSTRTPSSYLEAHQYLVSTDLLASKLSGYLNDKYKDLFSDDELYDLILHGDVWLYYAGYAVEETLFSYFIQVGKDISRRDFIQIWQNVIKPKQVESRNRGPKDYKMLYAIKRASVFGDSPKEISKKLEDGNLECYQEETILIPKEVSNILLRAENVHLFNEHSN
jgi:hypothetical protein